MLQQESPPKPSHSTQSTRVQPEPFAHCKRNELACITCDTLADTSEGLQASGILLAYCKPCQIGVGPGCTLFQSEKHRGTVPSMQPSGASEAQPQPSWEQWLADSVAGLHRRNLFRTLRPTVPGLSAVEVRTFPRERASGACDCYNPTSAIAAALVADLGA